MKTTERTDLGHYATTSEAQPSPVVLTSQAGGGAIPQVPPPAMEGFILAVRSVGLETARHSAGLGDGFKGQAPAREKSHRSPADRTADVHSEIKAHLRALVLGARRKKHGVGRDRGWSKAVAS